MGVAGREIWGDGCGEAGAVFAASGKCVPNLAWAAGLIEFGEERAEDGVVARGKGEQADEVVVDRVLEELVVDPERLFVARSRLPVGRMFEGRAVEFDGGDAALEDAV